MQADVFAGRPAGSEPTIGQTEGQHPPQRAAFEPASTRRRRVDRPREEPRDTATPRRGAVALDKATPFSLLSKREDKIEWKDTKREDTRIRKKERLSIPNSGDTQIKSQSIHSGPVFESPPRSLCLPPRFSSVLSFSPSVSFGLFLSSFSLLHLAGSSVVDDIGGQGLGLCRLSFLGIMLGISDTRQ